MSLSAAVDVAVIGGAVGIPAAVAWVGGRVRRANRADTQEAITDAVTPLADRLVRIEAQFGPNGGGMRQKVDAIAVEVAELRGEFKQHTRAHR